MRCVARLAANGTAAITNSLPFMPAVVGAAGHGHGRRAGEFDVVESRRACRLDAPVYDLDVERTHNFVANGIVTHNSIYKFRGADYRNL